MTNTKEISNSQQNQTIVLARIIKVENSEGGIKDADKLNEQLNVNDNSSGITIKEENIVGCDIEDIDNAQEVRTTEFNVDKSITDMLRPSNGNVRCVLIPVLTRIDGLYNNQSKIRTAPAKAVSRKRYSCDLCEKSLSGKKTLVNHLAKSVCVPRPAVLPRFLCDLCGKIFRKRSKMTVHLNRHAGVYPFPCNNCEKRFVSKNLLKSHEQSHSEINFHCEICDKFFKREKTFKRHTAAGHFRVYNHHCNSCNISFTRKEGLKKHLKRHLGLLHKCGTCSKEFATRDELESHRAMHTNEKPYLCEVCGLSFPTPSKLKIHTTVHTGEKPFQCAECSKTFSLKCKLVTHMTNHSGERLFQCDICNKAFAKEKVMKLHRGIHFDSRPYKCSLCNYCFTQSSSLKRHMQTIHKTIKMS